MRNLLVLERDSIFKIGIADQLKKENRRFKIEEAACIGNVFQKSLFMASKQREGYDLFIVSVNKQENDVISFTQYVIRNKPELPILVFSYETNDWLIKNGISGSQNPDRYIKKVSCWEDIQQEVKKLLADPVILSSSSIREISTDFTFSCRKIGDT